MNRLIHNRAFIGILLVALQLAFLPNVSKCSDVRLLGDSCNCTVSASAESPHQGGDAKPSCCSQRACCSKSAGSIASSHSTSSDTDDETPAPDGGSKKTCSCFHGIDHAAALAGPAERHELQKKHASALPPFVASCNPTHHAVHLRLRSEVTPRARSGPPLQILYQVFLI